MSIQQPEIPQIEEQSEQQLNELIKLMKKGQADRVYAELRNNFPQWIGKTKRSQILFFKAIEFGYFTIVEILYEHVNEFLEIKDVRGNTPFLIAISNGQFEIAEFLQQKGCKLNEMNFFKENALHKLSNIKIKKNNYSLINLIIKSLTENKLNNLNNNLNNEEMNKNKEKSNLNVNENNNETNNENNNNNLNNNNKETNNNNITLIIYRIKIFLLYARMSLVLFQVIICAACNSPELDRKSVV